MKKDPFYNRPVVFTDDGDFLLHLQEKEPPRVVTRKIHSVKQEDVKKYEKILLESGYILIRRQKYCFRCFYLYQNGQQQVFLTYDESEQILTIVEDAVSVSEYSFGYSVDHGSRGFADFYMYGLPMDPGGYDTSREQNVSGYDNCGMLFVVRCCDNSLILVDGGFSSQFRNEGLLRLDRFLHNIAGKKAEEKVCISAWILTHSHADHIQGFMKLLQSYPDSYLVERVIANLPTLSEYPSASSESTMLEISRLIREKSPNCMEIKAHTGQCLQIADVHLQILLTQEDLISAETGKSEIQSYNDFSLVVRMTSGKLSLLLLGDIGFLPERFLVSHYSEEELNSKLVQVAHHCINPLSEIYQAAKPEFMLFPQHRQAVETHPVIHKAYLALKPYCKTEYYSGTESNTIGFSAKDCSVLPALSKEIEK